MTKPHRHAGEVGGRETSRRAALRSGAFAGAALLAAGGLAACQPELFPGMEAPTQLQQESMGWPAPSYINLEEGDNQDPSVDTPNYPYPSEPWYMQPGYLQG